MIDYASLDITLDDAATNTKTAPPTDLTGDSQK